MSASVDQKTASAAAGIPQHREVQGAIPATPAKDLDSALAILDGKKHDWARLPIADRRAILQEMLKDFRRVAAPWARAVWQAEGIPDDSQTVGEEWLAGPYFILRNIRLLDHSLAEIASHGQPKLPGAVRTVAPEQVAVQVFPQSLYDRIFYSGITAEVWMQPGIDAEGLAATQAVAYKAEDPQGLVSLVLGAGNVSSIGPMDVLYKLFVENKVVVLKMHPLNAYLGPLLAEGFQALVDWGVLRIVYGGATEGAYLCEHPSVDEIHITGSDKTVEAIVFGGGEEGRRRKAERRPKLDKPISSELGNVSPVIVVPGPWSTADIAYHAENLASMLTNNAGFNCNAARVIIQHREWAQRSQLLDAVRRQLAEQPTRKAYYPGAEQRFEAFVEAHPEAERFGDAEADDTLPWALIPDVDPQAEDDLCFRSEAFCGIFAETALPATSVAEFIGLAVQMANERLWGTLNCTLIVHPQSLKDPAVAAALERGVADLRYGTVAINSWAAIGYGLVVTPWGAFPGHDLYDIQSGSGVVHNTLMFDGVQKTVVRTPFRMRPKPVWFQSHGTIRPMAAKLSRFEGAPSPLKLPGIFWEALRG